MFIHFVILLANDKATRKEAKIIYALKDYTLSSSEIKNVIFRGNKRPPGSYFRLVYNSDPKTSILQDFNDLRVLFVLYDLDFDAYNNLHTYNFKVFKQKSIDIQLNRVVLKFVFRSIKIDTYEDTLILPSYLEGYISDFGSSDSTHVPQQLIKFLFDVYKNNRNETIPTIFRYKPSEEEEGNMKDILGNLTQLLKNLQSNKLKIKYE